MITPGSMIGEAVERVVLAGAGAEGPMPVEIARPARPVGGIAVIAHGRNGAPDQPQMRPILSACLTRGLVVLAPHLCNSAASCAAGAASGFTMAGHLADLAVVLGWAERERGLLGWRSGGALLCGHSMGAYAACRLAAGAAPGTVSGILAVSPVVSGSALIAARRATGPEALAALAAEVPGAMVEWPGHDLLPLAGKLSMPVAVIVGAEDTVTPPGDARLLAEALPDLAGFEIVPGEHHCPAGPAYEDTIARALDRILARG